MNPGILVTTDRHLDQVVGISQAASAKGHEVVIFAMREGTRLLSSMNLFSYARVVLYYRWLQ